MSSHEHGHVGHGHSHVGGHSHAPAGFGRAFAIGIALNAAYVLAEAFYGLATHSLALLADAGHNLGDVLGLTAAWGASVLGTRKPGGRYTYGLRRTSILAALGNAVLLLVVTGGIAWEALRRLAEPETTAGATIMVVAAVGIAVNGITAWLFMSGRKGDLNIRGAFTHMAADALVAAGVVVAGGLILWTGWQWLDPAISLVISAVIVAGTWSLLRDSVDLSLDAVPNDLHIWGMSTTEAALTAHLVRVDATLDEGLVWRACAEVRKLGVNHATFQVESPGMAQACELRPDDVV